MKLNIREIRGESWDFSKSFFYAALSDSICKQPSPYFSILFIKKGVSPNTITLLMIIFGVIGGVLFAIPFFYSKCFAVFAYWLWYIFDCSDGEVARYTKKFSKYGKELDWVAHLSCHSLFYLATFLCFYQERKYNMMLLAVLIIIFISAELIGRNLIAFDSFLFEGVRFSRVHTRTSIVRFLTVKIFNFPTFVLFFPIFYVIDISFNLKFAYYFFIIWGTCLSLYSIKEFIRYIVFFYKN